MATSNDILRRSVRTPEVEAPLAMGDFRRGLRNAVSGFQANVLLADEASALADGDLARARDLRERIELHQSQQALTPLRVGRVEDVQGVGDAADYAQGMMGSGLGSMAPAVGAGVAAGGLGAALSAVPNPIARAIGAGLRRYGTTAAPLAVGAQQMKGEFYGQARENPNLMAQHSAEDINRMANVAGVAGGALDAIVPGRVASSLTGRAFRAPGGAAGRAAGNLAMEGLTELGQGEIGRGLRGYLDPTQDTAGFASDRLNEFVGGAIGAGPFAAAGAVADTAFGRAGEATETARERIGEVTDLATGAVAEGTRRGREKVVDLKEVLKERTGAARSGWEARQEELDLLNLQPNGIDPTSPEFGQWFEANRERRNALVSERLTAMGDDPQAQDILARMADPTTADGAIDEGAAYLVDQARVANVAQAAARTVGNAARRAGAAATDLGRAAWEGFQRKQNRQGAEPDGDPELMGEFLQDAAERQRERYTRAQEGERAARSIPRFMNRLGQELSSMIDAGVAADDNALLHIDRMAQHMAGAYGLNAPSVAQELARMQPHALTQMLVDRVENALSATNDTVQVRRTAAERLLDVLPPETEKRLLREGINLRSDEGKRQLLGMVESLAMGRVPPATRRQLAGIVGGDEVVSEMIQAVSPTSPELEAQADAAATSDEAMERAGLVMESDQVVDAEETDAQDQRDAEKKLERRGGARYFGFGRLPTVRNSKTSRDPFGYTERLSREEIRARLAAGEDGPRRPQLMRADQKLSSGESAIDNKIASMERYLGANESASFEVGARTAREVMDSTDMPPSKRLQLFADYMVQEGKEVGGERGEQMRELGRTARRVLLDELSGARAGRGEVAGTKDANARSTAGERSRVRKAMKRYFDERYLVVGERMSDVDPERVERADFDKMVDTGKTIMAQREAKTDPNGHAHRNNVLFFEDNNGNSMPILAEDVAKLARTARRANEMDAASGTRAWVNDLMTGISALTDSGLVSSLPTRLDAAGNVESFADGIPLNLMLPSGKLYGEALSARRRNPRSIQSEGVVEEEQAQDFFTPDDTALPERSDQDEFEGVRIRTREQGMEAANLPRGEALAREAAQARAQEVAATPGKSRSEPDGVHESRIASIAEGYPQHVAARPTLDKARDLIHAAVNRGVPRESVFESPDFKPVWADLNARRAAGEDVTYVEHRLAMMADQLYGINPSIKTVMAARTRLVGGEGKLSEYMADVIADPNMAKVFKVIAGAVTKIAGGARVRFDPNMPMGGSYSAARNDIAVALASRLDPVSTVMHEGVHAATVRAMEQDVELTRAAYALMAHVVKEDPSLQKAYGLTNTLEFMAEGMANAGLQQRLMKIRPSNAVRRYLGESVGNAWDAFVGLVRKALGVSPEHDSALMQLFELTGRAMRARAHLSETSTRDEIRAHQNMAVVPSRVVRDAVARIRKLSMPEDGQMMANQYTEKMEDRLRNDDEPVFTHRESLELEMVVNLMENYKGELNEGAVTQLVLEADSATRLHQYPTYLDTQLNAQDPYGTRSTAEDQQAAKDYIEKVLGPHVKTVFKDITGYSGEWIEASNTVEISTTAGPGAMQTAYHEALHAFFSKFVRNDQRALGVLKSLAEDKAILDRVQALLADDKAALQQLRSGEERLAYIYQFWAAGLLDLPYGQPRTLFQKIARFFRRVLGMVTDTERAAAIFDALHAGKFSDNVAGMKAKQDILSQGLGTQKAMRKMDGLVQHAAALTMPAESVLANSKSEAVRDIGKTFFNNPGDTGSTGEPGYINAREQMGRRYVNEFSRIVQGLSERDYTDIAKLMNKGVELSDIKFAPHRQSVKELRALLKRFRHYMVNERGVKMGDLGEKYYPRVWSIDKLVNNQKQFLGMMALKYPDHDGMAVFNAITQHLADDLEYGRPQREDGVLTPLNRSGEARVLAWMDAADAAPFLEDNLVGTMTRYFHEGARAAEYTTRFGQDGSKLVDMLENAQEELAQEGRKLLTQGVLKDEAAANKWTERQMRDVRESVAAMEGTLGKDISAGWRATNSWVVVYQNIRLLPLSLFASIVDPMGMVVRGAEFREAYDSFLRGMTEVGRQWKNLFSQEPGGRSPDKWERLAQYVGSVDAGMFEAQVSDMYSSVYMNPRARAINETFFRLNGMEAWNRGMRVGATKTAVQFIQRHSKKPSEHSERWLAELGLKDGDVMLDSDGNLQVTVGEIANAKNVSRDEARVIAGRLHNAINRWVTGAILTPNAAQRPAWSSDPHYSMFFHLKQFTYSFHQTILKRAVGEAQHGNIAPMGALFWYIPIMIGSDIMKGLIQGGGELPQHLKGMDAAEWVLYGAERGGIAGLGTIGIDASQDLASVAGPAVEQVLDAFQDPLDRTFVRALPGNPLYREALL